MAETNIPSSKDQVSTPSAGTSPEVQASEADQRMRPEVEAERTQAQKEAEKSLDKEAVAAVQQTERAVSAIAQNRIDEALSAIEQATGKINILLSRNPASALIPVNLQVSVIDTAPRNNEEIIVFAEAASLALDHNDLPRARTLLDTLRSEIRVRIYNLPLATYPAALQRAARLIDEKKARQAGAVLLVALNTLAIVDQVTPLPLLLAREAVNAAQVQAQKDREAAQTLLDVAEHQLERAVGLGYTVKDSDYAALRDSIKDLRKQLRGNQDTGSLFSSIKDKLASLTRRRSEKKTKADTADTKEQPRKAA